ncbi:hypothetical protein ACIO3O_33300 [Streptomyces sp. NPDC087440]|uniref:hypothetical protein n=1 Tax=Streptomyces sp. NPDC087440 TaxID=3365790 RepID=UPI0038062A94
MEQAALGSPNWSVVRARPLLVLSLRSPGGENTWMDTWRDLTALVFSCGLATRETQAVEVRYDVGTSQRFDACLSIRPLHTAAEVSADDLARVPGVRMETVMGSGPYLHRGPGHGHPAPAAAHAPALVPAWPRYHVYGCSPALAGDSLTITDTYITLAAAVPARR